MGKMAWVDLTTRQIRVEEVPQEYTGKYLGSRGIAARILYDHVGPDISPFDPRNLLIFSVGPFTGTPWPCGARYTVTAKSPATGAYGYGNSSGFFGPELRKAGYDLVVITGKASEPVYLSLLDGQIDILPAGELWGKTTAETETILRQRYPGSRVASIGPAGENLVYFAAVINDYARAAARTGMGAVMGSKNLKALVVKGSQKLSFPPAFVATAREAMARVREHPGSRAYRQWGTVVLIASKNKIGDMPSKNHRWGQFPGGKNIDAQAVARYTVRTQGCFACPIRCSRITCVPEGPFKTPEAEGPEYETTNALGSNLWNDNIEVVIHANKLCNELGLDTISTGMVISFAMEAREKGLLQAEKYSLAWGDPETILGLIRDIAYREGLGELLAEGVKGASMKLGSSSRDFALHVKGVEVPRQEGRVLKAFGLAHATGNRGADHLYALPIIDLAGKTDVAEEWLPECGPELMQVTSEKFKAHMVRFTEACNALADALGICKFSFTETYALSPYDLAKGLRALGIPIKDEEILLAGQRIVNLERMYNVRHGLGRKDDYLPPRFLKEPLDVYVHPEDIERVSPQEAELLYQGLTVDLDTMLDEYYTLGGWTKEGIPTPARLKELGLEDLIKDLPRND
ncbi:aldehyde ferredoxin oxidoreductase family protein [Thermanaeromonas sp. C210]|uniref:aldehyde ferredoxin oxidoreductase family protein n=1 Tax=Thermanaeromonas sp. C210 TaxID=2731925 RepID=UPI00155C97F1|nr:aldehyde ferredoxin oxidoreductase family protein [Thermanaeromonas sp. C210]GFN23916.1 aldehyde ferredoxin oxidoreductase [Thermanaeromonas sp. C210]